ncbi:hypothetical protein ACN5L4_003675 [Cronobacter turicensis]
MTLSAEARDILRQYKNRINAQRKKEDLSPVTTAQVMESICEYMTHQTAVYLYGQFIKQR